MFGIFIRLILGLCFAVFLPSQGQTADIKIHDKKIQGYTVVSIIGEIKFGDDQRFENTSLQVGRAIVFLDSLGGDVKAGIGIGKTIKLKGDITAVGVESTCASACGFIWLGGSKRLVFLPGKIGFHAAYRNFDGQAIESGAGNALVGAYFNQLGLTNTAIEYLTEAPPESMQWLTPEIARILGIETEFIPQIEDNLSSLTARRQPKSPAIEETSPQSSFTRFEDRDIYGYDIREATKVTSYAECQRQCEDLQNCNALTYVAKTSMCYLKNGGDRVWWSKGAFSAVRTSFVSQIRLTKMVVYPSTDLDGNEFGYTLNSKTEACVELCEREKSCTGFTFSRQNLGRCSLKSGNLRRKSQKRIIAGVKTAK